MSAPAPAVPQSSLADRLRAVHVGVRQDLDVSRHLFRGEVSYIVCDPITFQNHRLDQHGYDVFVAIKAERSLGEIHAELVARGVLPEDDEESFFEFVFMLHRLGFLALPLSDEKNLYRRFTAKREARRRRRWLSILFLRIPVWNPDGFLSRTMRYAQPLYSRTALLVWLLLVAAAGFVAFQHRAELSRPLDGMLAAGNLAAMWFMLIGLKVLHEFGHAYACKRFGGHVPDMGVYLILGTPCAYVDATASWSFTKKSQRLIVCLAGMYVESAAAAIAVFVWAFSDAPFVRSIAYNVMFLASVTTILFNINPLLRYDGYYILSDLLEVPNLRQRATGYVQYVAKRLLLGIRPAEGRVSRGLGVLLLAFGIASAAYRVVLVLAIAAAVGMKLFFVGLAGAAAYVLLSVGSLIHRTVVYLWFAQETAPVRGRAILASVLLIGVGPVALALLPVRGSVSAAGVVRGENETVVRAELGGFLETPPPAPGTFAPAGTPLARLRSDDRTEAIAEARARISASRLRRDALLASAPAQAALEALRLAEYEAELAHYEREVQALEPAAPVGGHVADGLPPQDVGRYVARGEPVATLVDGAWDVRVVLSADQIAACAPRVGDEVRFRTAGAARREWRAEVVHIRPAGSNQIEDAALTHVGGGEIPVDPASGAASSAHFEVTIRLRDADAAVRRGMTGRVRFAATAEPLGLQLYRRVVRFADRLQRG